MHSLTLRNMGVKIGFVGDVNPCLPLTLGAIRESKEDFQKNAWGHLDSVDLIISNLETPIFPEPINPRDSIFSFSGHEDGLMAYPRDGRHVISIANNHIMDCGERGLDNTVANLRKLDLDFIGAGKTITEASEPIIKELSSQKFIFFACAEPHFSPATDEYPGNNVADFEHITNMVNELGYNSDWKILTVHGGQEFVPYPSRWQIKLVDELCDVVDVIHFHHSHIFSGTEVINGTVVIWGSGNHVFQPLFPINIPGWKDSVTHIIDFHRGSILDDSSVDKIYLRIGDDGVPKVSKKLERKKLRYQNRLSRIIKKRKLGMRRTISQLMPRRLSVSLFGMIYLALFIWGPVRAIRYIFSRLRHTL